MKTENNQINELDEIFKLSPSLFWHSKTYKKKSGQKSDQSLSLRPDVMNKNIFRTLKKLCKSLFMQRYSTSEDFGIEIKKFAKGVFETADPEFIPQKSVELADFTKYLGLMINFRSMKKRLTTSVDKQKAQLLNDILYKYTHRAFNDFISIPEVQLIIRIIFQRFPANEFVKQSKIMEKFMPEYERLCKSIVDSTYK